MRLSILPAVLAIALVTAACGSDDNTASVTSSVTPTTTPTTPTTPTTATTATTATSDPGGSTSQDTRELTEIRWVLDGFITVGGADTVPAGIEANLTFDDTTHVSIETSCNQGSATVTLGEGGAISFGPVTLTKMACSDDRNQLEARIVNLLGEPSYWSAHDGTLSLYPANITDTGMLFHAG